MIKVSNLYKSFGEIKAVRGISFEVRDGEITGLLGPNGAGKTTTLRMLYSLLPPEWKNGFHAEGAAQEISSAATTMVRLAQPCEPVGTHRLRPLVHPGVRQQAQCLVPGYRLPLGRQPHRGAAAPEPSAGSHAVAL